MLHARKLSKAAHEAKSDASFVDAWREERAQSLKPLAGPSASKRRDALWQRIAARGAASSA